MDNREIHHIALATNSKTKKLYFDNDPKFIKWLQDNNKYFDTYPDNLTIYCDSTEEKRKIRNELNKLRD